MENAEPGEKPSEQGENQHKLSPHETVSTGIEQRCMGGVRLSTVPPALPSTKTNTSKSQFDFEVERLNTSPWLGRLGRPLLTSLDVKLIIYFYSFIITQLKLIAVGIFEIFW